MWWVRRQQSHTCGRTQGFCSVLWFGNTVAAPVFSSGNTCPVIWWSASSLVWCCFINPLHSTEETEAWLIPPEQLAAKLRPACIRSHQLLTCWAIFSFSVLCLLFSTAMMTQYLSKRSSNSKNNPISLLLRHFLGQVIHTCELTFTSLLWQLKLQSPKLSLQEL